MTYHTNLAGDIAGGFSHFVVTIGIDIELFRIFFYSLVSVARPKPDFILFIPHPGEPYLTSRRCLLMMLKWKEIRDLSQDY